MTVQCDNGGVSGASEISCTHSGPTHSLIIRWLPYWTAELRPFSHWSGKHVIDTSPLLRGPLLLGVEVDHDGEGHPEQNALLKKREQRA